MKLSMMLLFLFLLSCNVEEIFIINPSYVSEDTILEDGEEEAPNNEDIFPLIDALDDGAVTTVNNAIAIYTYLNDKNLPANIIVTNTESANGVLVVNNNNTPSIVMDDTMVYTPNVGFSGRDSFEYTICDANNTENCDTATVTVTIEKRPINVKEVGGLLKAFPSAEGAGANTTGGRGGMVYHVTNLNDSGNGSLREGIEGNGTFTKITPRTIIFKVSGTIVMNTWLNISGVKNLTVLGQTAPEGGISIQTPGFSLSNGQNIILRYIRFVNVAYFNPSLGWVNNTAALSVSGGNNVIVDHCSMRYTWKTSGFSAQDNNDKNDGQGNITLQRSIIGDCLTGALIGAIVEQPRAQLAGSNSVHHNLFAHVSHRFPNVSGDAEAEIIENVAYNYRARLSTFFNNSKSNVINNTYKAGVASKFSNTRNKIGEYVNTNPVSDIPRVYASGNRIDPNGKSNHTAYLPTDTNMAGLFVVWGDGLGTPTSFQVDTEIDEVSEARFRALVAFPVLGSPITQLGTNEAYNSVLADVGANKYLNKDGTVGFYLDTMDTHYIEDTRNGTIWSGGTEYVNKTDENALVYPVLPTNTRPEDYDTDRDGMPDFWEIAKFGNLNRTGSDDFDGDGYTDLEEFVDLVDF